MAAAKTQDLQKRIEALETLVKKQNVLIGKTGKSMLEMQIDKQRSDLTNFSSKKKGSLDTGDVATNEDLVQLVAELQGELNNIEERSIRRMANSGKTKATDSIAPLLNADGDVPTVKDSWFPRTVAEFEKLSDIELFRLAKFYERVPLSGKEHEKYEQYLEGKLETMKITDTNDEDLATQIKNYSPDQIDDIFNEVARYLGLPTRRGVYEW
ncbi:similar to Saccharomyces cerevisiae YKL142W MRP8 Protein of unknown function [Maudiozyma barnettii]|uniref:Uncharacterized protein n=1 Tax=Maudiozyma barnettii TaxID=61262 RepID=A0A8H2ZF29_9SACH|nr:Mrp8p [Kazachstania barnettii]CAB4252821.1 similar to Saccharomyces cerevisiae YKL142W MRP8 Protein of unknown function [Kazachstania barnettii]CAD1780611.1 similar to Saccharomyces cerevisiae YKL142W MRP8 Protein of unknown function [Kazachstania barnettii]